MGSLKDELLKAGLKATQAPKPAKAQNEREQIKKKQMTEAIIHQEQRNFCEECNQVRPDVELYYHRNPTTEAEWICVKCADQLKIADTFRQTAQSDTSIRKMFRREHGATRPATEFKAPPKNTGQRGPIDGNR
jgi:molybdenum cofactor biosynthesis enzyme MoaA